MKVFKPDIPVMTPGAWAAITAWGIPICWPRSWGAAKAPKTDAPATASLREGGAEDIRQGKHTEHSTRQHSQRSHSMTEGQPGLPLTNCIHIHRIVVMTGQIFSSAPNYSVYMKSVVGYKLDLKTILLFMAFSPLENCMTFLFMLFWFILPRSGSYLPVRPLNPFGRDSYLPGPLS